MSVHPAGALKIGVTEHGEERDVAASGPRRAVVVDDSSAMRMGIKGILKKLGLEIVGEGANGHEAIELARVHKPDIVMLDVNMPLMTGIDAIDGILEAHPADPVTMQTSVYVVAASD